MNNLDHERLSRIFAEAEAVPAARRSTFLDSTCFGEPELRRELEELLACADPASAAFDAASQQIVQPDPDRIGPYELLEPIGEGGMAIVYKAQQHHPVRRIVAVKLIKLGMDTRQFVSRFESERQALAMMDHPSIAKVHDAGATETGRPYFVMEHVPGLPILEYCDEHHLGLRQRLELFIIVCEAVEHAHRKGIIHRDLKNSNVLITEVDGRSLPKVIDFGVAKAVSQRLTDRTMFTEQGQLIGTPAYMSPEQAERGALDVDTRSDVYSLGVLLYELIAGVEPISSEILRGAGYEHLQRIIRETEPARPSTRLSALADADGTRIAERRHTALPTLIRNLRSELEWIPLKAMRKDREQRYRSAAELADDVRNYLDGRPLIAGPESTRYKLRKFLRRHRAGVAVSAAMVLLLLAGIAVSTWQAVRATRAEARASTERDNAHATLEFLTNRVLSGARPENIPDLKVREQIVAAMITPAAKGVAREFKDRPIIEASVRDAIQRVLKEIGHNDFALPHAQAALELRHRVLGEDHPDTLSSLNSYATIIENLGRAAEAEALFKQALETRVRVFGNDHPDTITALVNYANLLRSLDRDTEADPLLKEALERRRRVLGQDHLDTIHSMNSYALVLQSQGRVDEAEPLFRQSLEACRRILGDDHPDTMKMLNNYASVLWSLKRPADAEPLLKESYERYQRVLGEDHQNTITAQQNYAAGLGYLERWTEAEPLFKDVMDRRVRVQGDDHPETILALHNYGSALRSLGRYTEAESFARQAAAKATTNPSLGPNHERTKIFSSSHAKCLDALGRHAEAAAVRREFGLPEPTRQPNTQPASAPR